MHEIGSRDDDAIDVLLLIKHDAIVGVALGLGNQIVLEVKNVIEASFHLRRIGGGGRRSGSGARSRMIDMILEI